MPSSSSSSGTPTISASSFNNTFTSLNVLKSLGASGKGKVAAILPDTTSSTRYVEFDQPMLKKALLAAGVPASDIIIQNAGGSDSTFYTDAQSDITNGASVILSDPEDSGTGAKVESYAAAHGVKVIDYDRLTLGGSRPYYVSFNNVTVGKVMGQGLVSCVAAWGVKHPNVIFMRGDPTDNNATLFHKGSLEVLGPLFDSKKWTLAATPAGTWTPTTAQSEFEQAFTAHSNANAALIPNDENGAPIITYLKTKGVKPNTFPITGQDATLTGLQNILSGYQCGTVYKPIFQEASAAAALAVYLRASKTPPSSLAERDDGGHPGAQVGSVGAAAARVGDHEEHERDDHQGQLRAGEAAVHGFLRRGVQEGGDYPLTQGRQAIPSDCSCPSALVWAGTTRLEEGL